MGNGIVILDGGMSRELERLGAPFRQPEWSALALMETPEIVEKAHVEFIEAGAEVITTNNYAVVPYHIGEKRFADEGRRLIELSGKLARSAADRKKGVRVAGCVPPVFGSYRPKEFDPVRAPKILAEIVGGLAGVADLWLVETTSSIAEMEAAVAATVAAPKPLWVALTLEDGSAEDDGSRLRSGESVREACAAALSQDIDAVLFNCSTPEIMSRAIDEARRILPESVRIGVYANGFARPAGQRGAKRDITPMRKDLDPAAYLALARQWREHGASIIGGCCGIGCSHIEALSKGLD
ncbi:homocysteine S-methyltransferase family protein [Nisaea acidiphila]|uniref:Homocysteine S-methyltransferase family protein n=1 Tax=Nisaea acidiphila TaxID=1862145 RepID=A0A9J7AY32_9PROT|nr:homocysteine S-methyltransferase family protein [Nisaea acidiphila]UUX51706.1 homocysteine S-methyltransferase family protein [Nisaea acidiphila]